MSRSNSWEGHRGVGRVVGITKFKPLLPQAPTSRILFRRETSSFHVQPEKPARILLHPLSWPHPSAQAKYADGQAYCGANHHAEGLPDILWPPVSFQLPTPGLSLILGAPFVRLRRIYAEEG